MRQRSAVLAATALAVTALAGVAVAGCSQPAASTPTPRASPTYVFPPRPARLSETPLATASAVSGPVTISVIGLRAHMSLAAGTHADFAPKGEFDRLRVVVVDDSRTFLYVTLADFRLVTGDGTAHRPDGTAMAIKRQSEEVDIGAGDRAEFDLWYDVPKGSKLRALRYVGLDPAQEIPLPTT